MHRSTRNNITLVLISLLKVSLWKETLEGQWVCISDVNKGQGQVTDKSISS